MSNERKFYIQGKQEIYKSFESAYDYAYNRTPKISGNRIIRMFINQKANSQLTWKESKTKYNILGVKDINKKERGNNLEQIVENKSLFDCYKDIVKNRTKYFSEYKKLALKNANSSGNLIELSFEEDYLNIIGNVLIVLDKKSAIHKLDRETKQLLLNDFKNPKEEVKKEVAPKKEQPKPQPKEKVSNLAKVVDIKEIIEEMEDKKIISEEDEIIELTTFNPPKFEERMVINKDFWVEIRLSTSTIVDKTEVGDWKSTNELYNSLRRKFPNKEIALMKNDNGKAVECFKSSRKVGEVSVEVILGEYRKILNSLNRINKIISYVNEEAEITNKENIVSYHILENSSFFSDEDFKKSIIKEKCRLDDRREIKAVTTLGKILPNNSKMEQEIKESLKKVQKTLDSYFGHGEDYLTNNKVNDIFSFKDEKECERMSLQKKNEYKVVKKSTMNKELHCFSKIR